MTPNDIHYTYTKVPLWTTSVKVPYRWEQMRTNTEIHNKVLRERF